MCGLDTIFLFNIMEGYIQLFTTSSDLVFQTSHKKNDIMINESYTHCLVINDCPSHNTFSRIPHPNPKLIFVLWRKKQTKINAIGSNFVKYWNSILEICEVMWWVDQILLKLLKRCLKWLLSKTYCPQIKKVGNRKTSQIHR